MADEMPGALSIARRLRLSSGNGSIPQLGYGASISRLRCVPNKRWSLKAPQPKPPPPRFTPYKLDIAI
ncbi:hypothetical protein TWF718_009046 [Orbilia javanica]|uniref:Uncharacterized protein n=1 Tax=Orbilia javanica TaxID=47235 RepID=A0AAN8RBD9_9PEZI